MDVPKGFIISDKGPKENFQYSKICQFQDTYVSKINEIQQSNPDTVKICQLPDTRVSKIEIKQSNTDVVKTSCSTTSIERTSKPKQFKYGASQEGTHVHSVSHNSTSNSVHQVGDGILKNKDGNSVAVASFLNKKFVQASHIKQESDESMVSYPVTVKEEVDTISQERTASEPCQFINHTFDRKDTEVSVKPSSTSNVGDSIISQGKCGRQYDFNFIRDYWIAAFASNPEYGLYELPPQNGYCCPFCDFVGKESTCVLSHWKIHGVKQQYSQDNDRKSYSSGRFSSKSLRDILSSYDYHQESLSTTHDVSANNLQDMLKSSTCHICHIKFSKNRSLHRHMIRHYKSEPFKCNICDRAFFLKQSLDSHKKMHNQSKYKCDHCGKEYTYEISLERHLRTVHQE